MRAVPATYSRYSSDRQRAASIADQQREQDDLISRERWPAPLRYQDSEISGERRDRPDFVRLMGDARQGKFNVLVLWDLKRLSRGTDLPQILERLVYYGVRVITVNGYDSSIEGADIRGWVDGMFGHRDLRELARSTHRGLKGRALEGASAGGLPYGYRVTQTGEREIVREEAAIVRRIYADYISGMSVRRITKALNDEGIPTARGTTWAVSAIHPDHRRGIGILANPIYRGRQIWNRSHWVKHPDTGKRQPRENPESEWIVNEKPELAIVDPSTWEAARAACERRSVAQTKRRGSRPKHLLTGLLRCCECGGPFVVVDARCYGCATAKDRGTCSNRIRVNRMKAEAAMLAGAREILLSDEAMSAWQKAVARQMREAAGRQDAIAGRLTQARRERDNVVAAIREGIRLPSTKAELERLEALCTALEREANRPAYLMPDVRGRLQKLAQTLAEQSSASTAVREALRAVVGEAVVETRNGMTGAVVTPQIGMVAGA